MHPRHLVILRIAMAISAAAWLAWWIYSDRIAPLVARRIEAARSVQELREQILRAQNSIKDIHKLEKRALESQTELDRRPSDVPVGSAVIWFPQRLKKHFDRPGFAVGITRVIAIRGEPFLPGYKRSYWSIDLPIEKGQTAKRLLLAVAELEQLDRFVKVTDVSIRPDVENPGNLIATVSVSALARE